EKSYKAIRQLTEKLGIYPPHSPKTDEDIKKEQGIHELNQAKLLSELKIAELERQVIQLKTQIQLGSKDYIQKLEERLKELDVAKKAYKRRAHSLESELSNVVDSHTQEYRTLKLDQEELYSMLGELQQMTGVRIPVEVEGLQQTLSKGVLSDSDSLHPEDRCLRVIRPAVNKALPLVEDLKQQLKATESTLSSTMSLYGENFNDKEELETFFEHFSSFVLLYRQVKQYNLLQEDEQRAYERQQARYKEEQKIKELQEIAAREGRTNADSVIEQLRNPDHA
ncbi:hypothetical protein FF38_02967, partial [Lucilia cuprina]